MSTMGPAAAIAALVSAGLATIVLRTRRPPAVPPATPPATPRTVAELVQLRAEAATQAASRSGGSVGVEPTPLLPAVDASSMPVGVGIGMVGHDPDRGAPLEVEAVRPPSRPVEPQVAQRNDRAETAPAASWTAPARNGVGDPPWVRARWISRVEGPEPLPAAPDRLVWAPAAPMTAADSDRKDDVLEGAQKAFL